METLSRNSFARVAVRVELTEALAAKDFECDCVKAAYLDLLARYRALLANSSPALERAALDEAAAIQSALALGAARMAA